MSRPEYVGVIERWIARGASGAEVTRVDAKDDPTGEFTLEVEFSASGYGQTMQDRLLIFKPAVVSRRDAPYLAENNPQAPGGRSIHVPIPRPRTWRFPTGSWLMKFPEAVELTTSFGTYAASWSAAADEVHFTRTMELRTSLVPAEDYPMVREFFSQIHRAEDTPVVLIRK